MHFFRLRERYKKCSRSPRAIIFDAKKYVLRDVNGGRSIITLEGVYLNKDGVYLFIPPFLDAIGQREEIKNIWENLYHFLVDIAEVDVFIKGIHGVYGDLYKIFMNNGESQFMGFPIGNGCFICNSENELTRHHIIPRRYFRMNRNSIRQDIYNMPFNVVMLCKSCHNSNGSFNIERLIMTLVRQRELTLSSFFVLVFKAMVLWKVLESLSEGKLKNTMYVPGRVVKSFDELSREERLRLKSLVIL